MDERRAANQWWQLVRLHRDRIADAPLSRRGAGPPQGKYAAITDQGGPGHTSSTRTSRSSLEGPSCCRCSSITTPKGDQIPGLPRLRRNREPAVPGRCDQAVELRSTRSRPGTFSARSSERSKATRQNSRPGRWRSISLNSPVRRCASVSPRPTTRGTSTPAPTRSRSRPVRRRLRLPTPSASASEAEQEKGDRASSTVNLPGPGTLTAEGREEEEEAVDQEDERHRHRRRRRQAQPQARRERGRRA